MVKESRGAGASFKMSVGVLAPSAQEVVGEPAAANIFELRRVPFEWEAPTARVSKSFALGSGLLAKSDAQVVEDVQAWSQHLKEVIVDRYQVGVKGGCWARKIERLNSIQSFALWMEWDIVFSELL